jgi:preprotein translocase subunit YajC
VAFIIILVAMLVLMYFLLIRPQRANQRKAQDMLAALKPGDEVITIGGIYGDVVEVDDDKVVLEIAEDVHIEVTRRAISNIVPPETELEDDEEAPDELEAEATGEPEEVAVEEAADEVPDEVSEPEPVREESRWGFGRRSR